MNEKDYNVVIQDCLNSGETYFVDYLTGNITQNTTKWFENKFTMKLRSDFIPVYENNIYVGIETWNSFISLAEVIRYSQQMCSEHGKKLNVNIKNTYMIEAFKWRLK